jgi:hypothetical protein
MFTHVICITCQTYLDAKQAYGFIVKHIQDKPSTKVIGEAGVDLIDEPMNLKDTICYLLAVDNTCCRISICNEIDYWTKLFEETEY